MYIKVFGETPMADVEIIFPDKTLGIKPFQVRGVLCVGGAWVGARGVCARGSQGAGGLGGLSFTITTTTIIKHHHHHSSSPLLIITPHPPLISSSTSSSPSSRRS